MAVFKVRINGTIELAVGGTSGVVPPFTPKLVPNKRPNGEVQSVVERWPFRSIVPADGSGASGLKSKRDALVNAFEQPNATVEFLVDGVVFEKIGPATHARGAFFENFDVEESGAEWVNLLVVTFTVVGERAVAIPNVLEATETLTFETVEGKMTITTDVEARGPGALAFVQSFAPANATRSRIVHIPREDRASGSFVQEPEAAGGVPEISITETVSVSPGIFPASHRRTTRSDTPITFYASKTPTHVRISGTATVRPSVGVAIPIPDSLAPFLVREPSLERSVSARAESIDPDEIADNPVDEVRYSAEFELPSEVGLAEMIEQRRAIAAESFLIAPGTAVQSGIVVQ